MPVPEVVIIGGPNGAGKSTFSRVVLPEGMVFVNADEIAKGLPETETGNKDLQAGRLLIGQMDALAREKRNFAVETTLSSRSLVPRLVRLLESGYTFQLIYIWLPAPDLSIERVAARVRRGGHDIPADIIRRRYRGGLQNLLDCISRWRITGRYTRTKRRPSQYLSRKVSVGSVTASARCKYGEKSSDNC